MPLCSHACTSYLHLGHLTTVVDAAVGRVVTTVGPKASLCHSPSPMNAIVRAAEHDGGAATLPDCANPAGPHGGPASPAHSALATGMAGRGKPSSQVVGWAHIRTFEPSRHWKTVLVRLHRKTCTRRHPASSLGSQRGRRIYIYIYMGHPRASAAKPEHARPSAAQRPRCCKACSRNKIIKLGLRGHCVIEPIAVLPHQNKPRHRLSLNRALSKHSTSKHYIYAFPNFSLQFLCGCPSPPACKCRPQTGW